MAKLYATYPIRPNTAVMNQSEGLLAAFQMDGLGAIFKSVISYLTVAPAGTGLFLKFFMFSIGPDCF